MSTSSVVRRGWNHRAATAPPTSSHSPSSRSQIALTRASSRSRSNVGTSVTIVLVQEAWKTLAAAGLPDGPPRPRPGRLDFAAVRSALCSLDVALLDAVERVTLLAWLEGWRHHWPSSFQRELGATGEALRLALAERAIDANRYLKLRRIATENLSAAL